MSDLRIQNALILIIFLSLAIFLSSCAGTVQSRQEAAQTIILRAGLQAQRIETATFPLFSARSQSIDGGQPLTVVIEGDGFAWASRYARSIDPTPKNPVGLKIAAALSAPTIYLARPCQYITAPACNPDLWSSARFSDAVITAYMEALDQISRKYGTSHIQLIGYSGGAYIALILAGRRDDIAQVTSVAGLLDPDAWTAFHNVLRLDIPAPAQELLRSSAGVPFTHICSPDDTIMPCHLAQDIIKQAAALGLNNHQITVISGETHATLWQKASFGVK